jgi:hypothetical protein
MNRQALANRLRREGWAVANIAADGKRAAIAQVSDSGLSRWAEIAVKDSPTEFRATKELRHGIDLPYWEDCLAVEYETVVPGYLFIIQHRPLAGAPPNPMVLMQSLQVLRNTPVQEIPPGAQSWAPKGLIVWRAEVFLNPDDDLFCPRIGDV